MAVEKAAAVPEPPEVKEPEHESSQPHTTEAKAASPHDESVHDISYHPGRIILYSPPQQRQKWGESQVLPRVNWGDTFYDLFFVAAAYNVANILVDSPTGRGVLYFVTCFFAAISMWRDKVYYDSRYVIDDDLYHRFFETMLFVGVAFGFVHINPISIMSNPREHPDMFAFALVVTIFTFLNILGYIELYLYGVGQRSVLKEAALRDIRTRSVPFGLQLAATIVAGVEYFVYGAGGSGNNDPSYEEGYSVGHTYTNDIPIWLLLGAQLIQNLAMIIIIQFLFPKDGSHKNHAVPINITFLIHRDGEWIMLMLGESILSLLIVDVSEGEDYYITFFCGILTIVSLHYLHYRSQPRSADSHATRRNKDAGVWWNITNSIYSASLIGVGVAYKLFMYEFTYEARRLQNEVDVHEERLLAESVSSASREQAAANVFSVAMTLVFTCLDVILLFHRGLKSSIHRCQCARTKRRNKKGILLTIVRVAITLFFATLSQYESDPLHLSVLGLAGVVAQLIIRRIGIFVFPESEDQGAADKNLFDGKVDEVDGEDSCSEVLPGQSQKTQVSVEHEKGELTDIPFKTNQVDIDVEDNEGPNVDTNVEAEHIQQGKRDVVADNESVAATYGEDKDCECEEQETKHEHTEGPKNDAC